jgi:hypothetical protein
MENTKFNAIDNLVRIDTTSTSADVEFQNGYEHIIADHESSVTIEITGNTSGTIIFEGAGQSGTFYAIQGEKLSDGTKASQTTGNKELWRVNLIGLYKFRARQSVASTTAISINGKVM